MLKLLLLIGGLCAAFLLSAAPLWNLYTGAAIVQPRVDYATQDACTAGAMKQAPGSYTCRSLSVVPVTVPMDMHGGLTVDPRTIPTTQFGVKDDRLTTTGRFGTPSDIGSFRTACYFSHAGWDDPIVYPGQPGKSHLHYFFGNDTTNANSTLATLRQGGSTCRGGTVNQTAYWQPAMLNGQTAILPQSLIVYYKNGFKITGPFVPIPEGLKMVAGNPSSTGPQDMTSFTCINNAAGNGPRASNILACPAGDTLWASVEFPQCWDGKNLDSPDHRSHMAYPVQNQTAPYAWACPADHPVAIPLITLNVLYAIRPGDDTTKWRLASDMYTGLGGYSLHADWFNAWKPDVMSVWVQNCNNAIKDCSATMLGDGREMDEFGAN